MGSGEGNDTSTSTKKKKKRSNSFPGRDLENSGKSDISGLASEKEIFKYSGNGARSRRDSPRYERLPTQKPLASAPDFDDLSDSQSSSRSDSPTYYNSAMSDRTVVENKNEGKPISIKVNGDGGQQEMINLKADDINLLFSQLSMEEKLRAIGGDFSKLFSQLDPEEKKKLLKKDRDTDALILSEDQDDILSRESNLKLRLDELAEKREIIKKQIKRARRNSGELKERMDLMDENRDLGAFQMRKGLSKCPALHL